MQTWLIRNARSLLNTTRYTQRFIALFLFTLIMFSVSYPSIAAYAATQQPDISKLLTSSAPGLAVTPSKNSPAIDYLRNTAQGAALGLGQAGQNGDPLNNSAKTFKVVAHELTDKRTANSDTRQNADGSFTQRTYMAPKYFQSGSSWQTIDPTLVEDNNANDTGILGQVVGQIGSVFTSPQNFIVNANDWKARFSPSDFSGGMVRILQNGKQIGYSPIGARAVDPVITTDKQGRQTVHYYNLWPNIDVEYQVNTYSIKENIVLKSKSAANLVQFQILGASLTPQDVGGQTGFAIKNALDGQFSIAPLNLILNNSGPETDQGLSGLKQVYGGGILTVLVNANYLKNLPDTAFPAVIDPGTIHGTIGNRTSGNYISFKSDGYVCPSTQCNPQAGSILSGTWKYWRSAFFADYSGLQGKILTHANLHITRMTGVSYYTGDSSNHWFTAWRAYCNNGFNCQDGGYPNDAFLMGDSANADVTNIYQALINNGNWGSWLFLTGEEGSSTTYKYFDPDPSVGTWVDFSWVDYTPTPAITFPTQNQVFVDPQVSFTTTTPSNPNSSTPLKYNFCITMSPGCSGNGLVIISNDIADAQWTVPDNVLQDGTTYYVQVRALDPDGGGGYSPYSTAIPFKIDMRRGKDRTQTYDTVGPLTVDLATGNLATSNASHTSSALGGSLGVSLDYNSPMRSRSGLVGDYFANTTWSGNPALTRVDQNVNFSWQSGSPSAGLVPSDNFSARWSGYFIAPQTGDYYFGANNDDSMTETINGSTAYTSSYCPGVCYGSTAVHLNAGQVVPIQISYVEIGGNATARAFVKGPVSTNGMVIPKDWLQTGVRPVGLQYGLAGRYYAYDSGKNLDNPVAPPFLSRIDPLISFNWGTGPAVAGAANDFMVRWTGYINLPATTTYDFGTNADDGSRIKIDGNSVMDNWGACCSLVYGSDVQLSAGWHSITVDYYDQGGAAAIALYAKSAAGASVSVPEQVIPSAWLAPSVPVLPSGWGLGIDPDGNLNYDRLTANLNNVTLTDSTGITHTYTAIPGSSAYKPPVNEDGTLIRNADNTYTLTDVDGKTYVFSTAGVLASVTLPVDDRHPAALQFNYSGSPAKVTQITDGVDSNRYARVYYSGDPVCGSAPSGYDTNAPVGMLCAVQTNDGRTTYFYYTNGYLARILKPGNEATDYQYDTLGRIVAVRDSLANDAVNAGVRTADGTELTQVVYDNIGRVISVTAPAASAGANRQQKTYEYLPAGTTTWSDPQMIPGDPIASSVSLLNWGPGNLAMFARNAAGNALARFYQNGAWGAWQNLGGGILDEPHGASWQPGRIDLFARGTDNGTYTMTYQNGSWGSWLGLGSTAITSAPQAVSWATGRYDVVAKGPSNELLHRWYVGGWSGYESLGGCLSQGPAISSWGLYRLNIYVQGCGSPTSFFSKYIDNSWTDYSVLTSEANISSEIQSVSTPDRQIHVVARGVNGDLRYLHYSDTGNGWDNWQSLAPCINGTPAIEQDGSDTVVAYIGCDGNLYQMRHALTGSTKVHVTGATEPNGFTQKVDYDGLYRTTQVTDKAGLATKTEWDQTRDLLYSTTDATGMKSTTVYDDDSRPIQQYGPAPAGWYNADRTPQAAYASQVPHTDTAYDQGITGLGVSYLAEAGPLTNNVLWNGQSLAPGQSIHSQDGRFTFTLQTDGNIVLYGPNGPMWATGTNTQQPTSLVMQSDGNLVAYKPGGVAVWASGTNGGVSSHLVLQNDGNLIIFTDSSYTWATNTYGWGDATATNASLIGAPLLHGTNIATDGTISHIWGATPPISTNGSNWGFSMTGKMRLPTTGSWNFNVTSDQGVRLWIDDAVVINGWGVNTPARASITQSGTFNNLTANSLHRVRIDYYHLNLGGSLGSTFSLAMTPPGGTQTTAVANYFTPDYSLPTSTTTYDATVGNTTATTNYGTNPELGLAQSATVDATGLNLTSTATYETPGPGGYLRQTSTSLPGGVTTNYAYYGATDTKDNPCTQATEAYRQGGMLRLKTEPDPDGAGPQTGRSLETIYDDSGAVVASRYNQDPWTCSTYDTRGRATQVVVPTINGRPGRTITTNYAYQGNPLKVQVIDSVSGTTISEIDLLGRAVSATDTFGNVSTATYDNIGRLASKTSPLGTESYTYDTYDRPTAYAVNNTTYATLTYDTYSRLQAVIYNQAKDANNNTLKLEQVKYDALQRTAGATYRFSNGLAFDETLTRTQSGMVSSSTDAYNNLSASSSFSYDHAGRLTQATVDKNQYTYSYQAPSASICSQSSANLNAQKDSNRTSFTLTNLTTNQVTASATYCYDQADRLIASSDVQVGTPTYDDHGNTVTLAGNGTPVTFGYDASDSNVSITQGANEITYIKTASGSVLRKKQYQSGTLTASYRYLAGGAVMQTCSLTDDNACTTADTYLSLPGGVTLTLSPTNPTQSKQVVYSLKNFHGDASITVGSDGNPTSSVYLYEPFGQVSSSATFGTNSNPANSTNESMGWAASPTRKVEGLFSIAVIQMGARVYLPSLGRFLQVDPVEGGTANSYVYVGDPVNGSDYSGRFGLTDVWNWAKKAALNIAGTGLLVTGTLTFAAAGAATGVGVGIPLYVAGAAQYAGAAKLFAVAQGATESKAQGYAMNTFVGFSLLGMGMPAAGGDIQQTSPPPESAWNVWNRYQANNFQSIGKGYRVHTWDNAKGVLPTDTSYRAFYVNPSPNPGAQRLIQGDDGSLYYTPDHYGSYYDFQQQKWL